MSLRVLIGPIGLALAAATLAPPLGAGADTAERAAPDRGAKSTWTEADKAGFGTARARRSNVWFTLQDGRVSEVFYPDLSTPSIRSLELVVTDGRTFTDRDDRGRRRGDRAPDARSLRFTQVDTATPGATGITKTYVTDPRRDASSSGSGSSRSTAAATGCTPCTTRRSTNCGMDDRGRATGTALVATDGRSRRVRARLAPAPRPEPHRAARHATTAGPTCAATSDLDRAAAPPARATSCRPAGSRA